MIEPRWKAREGAFSNGGHLVENILQPTDTLWEDVDRCHVRLLSGRLMHGEADVREISSKTDAWVLTIEHVSTAVIKAWLQLHGKIYIFTEKDIFAPFRPLFSSIAAGQRRTMLVANQPLCNLHELFRAPSIFQLSDATATSAAAGYGVGTTVAAKHGASYFLRNPSASVCTPPHPPCHFPLDTAAE